MKTTVRWTIGLLVVFTATLLAPATQAIPIVNGGFEDPPGASGEPTPTDWGFFSSGPDTSGVVPSGLAFEGSQVLQFFGSPLDAGSFQGYTQDASLIVETSELVLFEAYVRSSPFLQYTNAMTLELKIEFFNNSVFLNSELLSITKDDITTGSWTKFVVSGAPSSQADQVRFVISQNVGFTPDDNGIVWVDGVAAVVVPEPSSVALALGALLGLGVFLRRRK